MTTDRRVTTMTTFVTITDKGEWSGAETYDKAVASFGESLARHRRIQQGLRERGVPETEVAALEADNPTELRGIVRRTHTTTYETTEEQLPYPPEDEQ